MTERMAAEIWIGGQLSTKQAEELCGAINDEWVSLQWGGGQFCPASPRDLLQASVEHDGVQLLWLCNDQASWGEFADLEDHLQEQVIPYTRRSEAGGGYNGEIAEYRPPDDPVHMPVDSDGNPTVHVDAMRDVAKFLGDAMELLESREVRKAGVRLKKARAVLHEHLPPEVPPLPSFEIDCYQPREQNHG